MTGPKCLVFDLEAVPASAQAPARITSVGALRPDTEQQFELNTGNKHQLAEALQRLDTLADGASFVLGHNIVEHDLPLLATIAPGLRLHELPIVDTLQLSPLAFPQNPYHRLLKDYKLVRDSLNSPLSDCRSTLTLFQDQREAFKQLHQARPRELASYQGLLCTDMASGLGALFASLTGAPPATIEDIKQWLPGLLAETDTTLDRDLKVCRTRLNALLQTDLQQQALRWPLAYVLAWLRVSGGNSVLAPWVRHQLPEVERLLRELRNIPCGAEDCQYCRTTHDPRHELERYFGFDDFLHEGPGQSLQHDIVLAGMQDENLLAVLPTGGGKSLCYQLPALNRYHRDASLTVIISPLQSLMKDQIDELQAKNIHCAATLNGLLTMPERAEVLDGIRMGDVGILLVSPEQFRNPTFRKALRQRQVGAWIYDEAHCLSKWGNDFRPDYFYVSRFIREYTGTGRLAPVGCFTATGKPDVLEEIESHFRDTLGISFQRFIGTPERNNLDFDVLECGAGEKWAAAHRLLTDYLGADPGGAIVFVASRRRAEEGAEFLATQGWQCRHFHANLEPHEKQDIQDDFKAGVTQVITATNAFGMGVDKSDIRLVVHADIPGSLENYLQEAGRAGRDRAEAHCVLLYDREDVETQFGMCERSRLQLRDLKQILSKIREESRRLRDEQLVITAGEILLDDKVDVSFSMDDPDAENRIATAIAWLERSGFLQREENRVRVFPGSLKLPQAQAEQKLVEANLPKGQLEVYRSALRFLYQTDADERVNTDALMDLTGMNVDEVSAMLKQMENLEILVNDTQITLYVRHGLQDSSKRRLEDCLQREKILFQVLREQAPDAEQGDWQNLNLSALTTAMQRAGELAELRPDQVLRLLRSLSADSAATNYSHSFDVRQASHELIQLRLRESADWDKLEKLGEKRRGLAGKLLPFLLAKLPGGMRGKDLLVETTFSQLQGIIDNDIDLSSRIPPEQRRKAIQHVLLYLHKQEVLTLNHGMTVMRRAMTIALNDERTGNYLKSDYAGLDQHYGEKRIQVHAIREYAEIALENLNKALQLVLDYFEHPRDEFLRQYFAGRKHILKLATSEESRRRIVEPLNEVQKQAVTDGRDQNRLILAGPGSGKTRVIVHRLAWLLRVQRVAATSIIALAFNRHAANEIRSRLIALVGSDAFGVSILTYHRMAMRLTGTRFDRRDEVDSASLDAVMQQAVKLLEGDGQIQHEDEDDLRARLLRGYRYILVDEYQDIDETQYRLVSALAGRHAEAEGQLCIMAVGDDDQNIYAWRHTSNHYIEQFQQDYEAEIDYLIDNYRSTAAIVAAANHVIADNRDRMKQAYPIQVDEHRRDAPEGGRWHTLDGERQGRVLRLQIPEADSPYGNLQAQAAMAELERLRALEDSSWDGCAVLARKHQYLQPLQAWCEHHDVPYFLAADRNSQLPLTRQRSFVAVIEHLRTLGHVTTDQVSHDLAGLIVDSDWQRFFDTALEQLAGEVGDCTLDGAYMVDWLYDYARELRQQPRPGLYLGTVHSAKGREFRHVVLLDGGWQTQPVADDERRLYYVGMTRAEQTLTLCEFSPENAYAAALPDDTRHQQFSGQPLPALTTRYHTLSLGEIDIGYPGRQAEEHAIHAAVAALQPGDPLQLQADNDRCRFMDQHGQMVGRTARSFQPPFEPEQCEVAGVVTRFADDSEEPYRSRLKCQRWELVVPLIKGRPAK